MNKEEVERIALEVAEKVGAVAMCKDPIAFTNLVIERIDAERGKEALGYDAIFNAIGQAAVPSIGGIAISVIAFKAAIGGEIFLSPTIPEGMALVPIEPTNEMKIAGDNAGFWCAYKWRAMIAAAQGERK